MWLIDGVVQHYHWGSHAAIPAMLGRAPTGEPWAEYWLGTHPLGAASLLQDPEHTLSDLISSKPTLIGDESVARFGPYLPYLIKVLSADNPLSLQVHPSREQAEVGFAREQAAGIPFGARERSFKDPWPKPELVVALTPFDMLAGFRNPRRSAELFARMPVHASLDSIIGPLTERSGPAALAEVFLDVLSVGEDRRHLVDEVVAAAVKVMHDDGELGEFARTAVDLDEHFPGDPGILAALLMNRVRLEPGQAVYMPAGYMHAHLRGTAVEAQANSDNVLRGALTQKHVDVDGLISVVDFTSTEVQLVERMGEDGVYFFDTPAPEFTLWLLQPADAGVRDVPATSGGRIVLATKGEFTLRSTDAEAVLTQGQAAFLPAGEHVAASGRGQLFVIAPGV